MNFFTKMRIYLLLFFPAAIFAGVYGSVHDQISYSLSPEYFTHFKFIQFSIPWAQESPRLGAAVVGAMATWWMGVLVFSILGCFGFIFPSPRVMTTELLRSFGIVMAVALVTGMLGLVYGYVLVGESNIEQYTPWVQSGVTDAVQFVRVGFMHNASYVGGVTGLFAGIVYLLFAKKRYNKFDKLKTTE